MSKPDKSTLVMFLHSQNILHVYPVTVIEPSTFADVMVDA